jgi:hypothetical protein
MSKILLCKYQGEKEWKQYIVDYTARISYDNQMATCGWANYMIPVMPYKMFNSTLFNCPCYCSEADKSYPTIKYDGRKYCMWKPLSARAFINKFNRDAVLLKEMSRLEYAINELE